MSKNPWDALREMLRVTKVGGIVAAREGDLETECVWPELPGLLKFRKFAGDMMTAAGGSSTAGRQLLSWALRAGVRREQINFQLWHLVVQHAGGKESLGVRCPSSLFCYKRVRL